MNYEWEERLERKKQSRWGRGSQFSPPNLRPSSPGRSPGSRDGVGQGVTGESCLTRFQFFCTQSLARKYPRRE